MSKLNPLPVKGYTPQDPATVALVNEGKELEERCLRYIEKVGKAMPPDRPGQIDQARCLVKGKTEIQDGWMWVFRGVFQPQRISLPEDPT